MPRSPKSTPQSNRGVPWAPSPLLSRLGFRVVWCCPVLFGHTLNQRTLLGICCPLRNRHCLNNCSFGMGGSLFFSPFPSLVSGQAKIRLRFTHRTRLVFALSEGVSSFFFSFSVPLSLSNCVLPRPAKICLRFLRPARCAWLFLRSCSALARSVLGFRGSVGRRLAVFLSLSRLLLLFFFFWSFGAATHFLMPRPRLG